MSINLKSGIAAAENSGPRPAQDLVDESIDISKKGKRQRPVNDGSSDAIMISDKRKPDENDDQNDGEQRKGEAKELETSPKRLGKPWGLSDVGPIGPENPLHSLQRALKRYENPNLIDLQKEPIAENDDDDDSNEDKNIGKPRDNAGQGKEKEKKQPIEKEKQVKKFDFFGNKFEKMKMEMNIIGRRKKALKFLWRKTGAKGMGRNYSMLLGKNLRLILPARIFIFCPQGPLKVACYPHLPYPFLIFRHLLHHLPHL
jgi:hypothetical protein